MQNRKALKIVSIVFSAFFIVLLAGIIIANSIYGPVLKVAFLESVVDEELMAESRTNALTVNEKLEAEGAVLLENDGILPLTSVSKVNVFGLRSVYPEYNGKGSSSAVGTDSVTLKEALESAGIEVNEDLWSLLDDNKDKIEGDNQVHEGDNGTENFPLDEIELEQYSGSCSFEQLKNYSEVAIVTIGRTGGEGEDLPRAGYGADGSSHYLELCENEKALLQKLESDGFKTVVLINSSYVMELGFLRDYNVNAALWIGGPGNSGFNSVAKILKGEINPSGRLVDTYPYDLTTQSSYFSAGNYKYKSGNSDIAGYTNFSEGIYLGYRWYETADAEGYWDDVTNSYGQGYDAVVQYPFGYGKSYTSFTSVFAGSPVVQQDGTIEFAVEVINTGNVAGKEVVQIYVETPYENGGTEKSKVVLAAFAKTEELAPGEPQTLDLVVSIEDIASYSEQAYGGKGAYVLDEGIYKFYLGDNSHCWKDCSENEVFDAEFDDVLYVDDNKRSSDVAVAQNEFSEGINGNIMSLDNGIEVLSRKDGFANASVIGDIFTDISVEEGSDIYDALITNAKGWGAYRGTVTDTSLNEDNGLTFSDMYDKEYEDAAWDDYVSQMSIDDMVMLIGTGGWSNAEIASIGKPYLKDQDGPFGLNNYITATMGVKTKCVSYCSEVVIASTFNVELAEEFGESVGFEANASNLSGWYAPGANTHRSAFGGRNAEYYSEDPLLAGMICAETVKGVQAKGVYVYVKHFAFNDIEANRASKQNCWLTEQTAREIYLKPFELAVKEGGAKGIMVSYMWINGTWGGGNYSLVTKVLRDEWGFKGCVVTDNYADSWMNATKAVMAGTDMILSSGTREVNKDVRNTDDGIKAMKEACKHILYMTASVQNDRINMIVEETDYWQIIYWVVIGISIAGITSFGGLTAYAFLTDKKSKMKGAQ